MNKQFRESGGISLRYLLILLSSISNLWIFYAVFTPLTASLSYLLLSVFYPISLLEGTRIIYNRFYIDLSSACIAGSAYFLLFILNMSIPNINLIKRTKMIFFAFISFLAFNILRMFIMAILLFNQFEFFDLTHLFFWYFTSTLLVIAIWFAEVKIFKIKSIPIYSDIKTVINLKHKKIK